ncbi:MAG: glycosyltransferase family 39 protein [Elusimicrobia bacterium]|nr:glycosyltransferase family 39 protein [Elusimicrobiota bacterium]
MRTLSLAVPASIVLSAALLGVVAARTGITYDEPSHIGLGQIYLSAPARLTQTCPPLPAYLRNLALWPLHPGPARPPAGREKETFSTHDFGLMLLFDNVPSATALVRAARLPSLLIAVLLGLVVWRWGKSLGGPAAAAAALLLYVFEPNGLAHASLATTDIFVAAFFCAACWAWSSHLRTGKTEAAWLAGAAAGAAIASKATGFVLLPAFAASLFWCRRRPRGLLHAFAAAAAVLAALYAPTGLAGFAGMLAFRAAETGRPGASFLFGAAYPNGHPLYFPAAFLVKTTIPLLILGAAGAFRLRRERPEDFRVAAAAAAGLLAALMLGHRQLGVRYLLPVYPLLCVAAGWAAAENWKRRRVWVATLLIWHVASSLHAFPFPLTYFNELAGGPANGRNVLGDSNLDWGQSLPELRSFMDRNPGGLILSYFGKDCPSRFGLTHQEAFSTPGVCPNASMILPTSTEREWLAVSATKWQGFYETGTPMWAWLRSRTPHEVLGYSMFVYDITNDADAHEQLAFMYEKAGMKDFAARERARASILKK